MKKLLIFLLLFVLYIPTTEAGIKGIIGVATAGPKNTLKQNLVSSYKLNDAETTACTACWLDNSSNLNHLSGSSDPATSGGVDRNSVANAAITIADSPTDNDNTLLLATSTINPDFVNKASISAWFNSSDGSGTDGASQYIYSVTHDGGPGTVLALNFNGAVKVVTFTVITTTGETNITSATTLTLNTWYHVMGIWDGATMNIYIDNVVDATPVAKSGTISPPSVPGTAQIAIGGLNIVAPNSVAFTGLLDDIMSWDKALTSAERNLVFGLGSDFAGID